MLDEKGRLFGKVNIIDLLIVVVLIAAVAVVGLKFFGGGGSNKTAAETTIVIYCEETAYFVPEQLTAGDTVYDFTDDIDIGELIDWETAPCLRKGVATDGTIYQYVSDTLVNCTVRVKINGSFGEHGVTINDKLLATGHSMVFYAGDCKLYGRIMSLDAYDQLKQNQKYQ